MFSNPGNRAELEAKVLFLYGVIQMQCALI